MVRTLIIAASLSAVVNPIARADCRQFFTYQKTYAAPVVTYTQPLVYYQAGRDIEAEAIAAKVAKIVVGQLRQEINAPAKQQAPSSALAQACARCHSGANPKGGVTIDGNTAMDCHSVLQAIRLVAADKMPPNQKLAPEQKGRLLDELLLLEQPADKSPPVAVPVPEESGVLK